MRWANCLLVPIDRLLGLQLGVVDVGKLNTRLTYHAMEFSIILFTKGSFRKAVAGDLILLL